MSGHLTQEEITRWLVEGPTRQAETHLQECSQCRDRLDAEQQPILDFRQALTAWSESQPAGPALVASMASRRPLVTRWMPEFGLAAALAVLVSILVYPMLLHRSAATEQAGKALPVSDTVLMDQVDEEVSETVPDAMAPLTDLVAWDRGVGTSTTALPAKRAVTKKIAAGAKSSPRARVSN